MAYWNDQQLENVVVCSECTIKAIRRGVLNALPWNISSHIYRVYDKSI